MPHNLTAAALCAAAVLLAPASTNGQEDRREPKRPSLSLKATPGTGMVPVRISATAEFKGGDDDFREYYCPTIEWNWGDGTISEASADCDPYEAGVSQIRRRYTVSHTYKRAGAYRISFRLKVKDRVLTSQTTTVRLLGGGF
jgi:PKD domain